MLGRAQGAFQYPCTKCHLRKEEGTGSQSSCPVHHCPMALPGTAVPRANSSSIFSEILAPQCYAQAGHSPMCLPLQAGCPPTHMSAMGLPSWQGTLTACESAQSYHAVGGASGCTPCRATAHHWTPAELARHHLHFSPLSSHVPSQSCLPHPLG